MQPLTDIFEVPHIHGIVAKCMVPGGDGAKSPNATQRPASPWPHRYSIQFGSRTADKKQVDLWPRRFQVSPSPRCDRPIHKEVSNQHDRRLRNRPSANKHKPPTQGCNSGILSALRASISSILILRTDPIHSIEWLPSMGVSGHRPSHPYLKLPVSTMRTARVLSLSQNVT